MACATSRNTVLLEAKSTETVVPGGSLASAINLRAAAGSNGTGFCAGSKPKDSVLWKLVTGLAWPCRICLTIASRSTAITIALRTRSSLVAPLAVLKRATVTVGPVVESSCRLAVAVIAPIIPIGTWDAISTRPDCSSATWVAGSTMNL